MKMVQLTLCGGNPAWVNPRSIAWMQQGADCVHLFLCGEKSPLLVDESTERILLKIDPEDAGEN